MCEDRVSVTCAGQYADRDVGIEATLEPVETGTDY